MRRRLVLLLTSVLVLAGCGGGVSFGIGIGIGGDNDDPPSVNLAVSPSAARVGDPVRLVAAASDDFGVDRVEFYRVRDDGSAQLLGTDGLAPFQWDLNLPATTAAGVSFFAVAVDGAEQDRESALVTVTVLR